MKVKKSERQQGEFKLKTGVFLGRVARINPTRKQLNEYLGIDDKEDDEEINYIGEDKEGNTRMNLSFWIEDVDTGIKFNHRLSVTDKGMLSEKSQKIQYCNQLGLSGWADDEKNLQEWFVVAKNKNKEKIADLEFRPAKMGEADLYDFLRNWSSKIDWFNPENNILLDIKKLFRGNVSEIQDLLKGEGEDRLVDDVVMLATVYMKDGDDGEVKKYQNIAKHYLPAWKMKNIRNLFSNGAWGSADKMISRWHSQIMDAEYGVKEAYSWSLLTDFDETKHQNAGNEPLVHSETPSDTDY